MQVLGVIKYIQIVIWEKWIHFPGVFLKQLHLHDNSGEFDDHLALGEGKVDFEALFRLLKVLRPHPLRVTLEPHKEEGLWPSLQALERIWPW